MKTLISTLALVFASSAFAQMYDPGWSIMDVPHPKSKKVIGYVYYTPGVGYFDRKPENKFPSSLSVGCSLEDSRPVIAIYWSGLLLDGTDQVSTEVDGRTIWGAPMNWNQDGNVTYRYVDESQPLVQALKNGRQIKFSWTGANSINRSTSFNLASFNTNLSKFTTACKISL
jgi:hypothetical protein